MPAYQTTYTAAPASGYAGMIADTTDNTILSRIITTGSVAYGLAVGRGATDGTARIGGAGYEGITVADKAQLDATYVVGAAAGVMTKGTIWVTASTAVVPGDPVTFTAATGVIGAGLATTIAGARFLGTAAIGALVQVYLG